MRLLLIGYMYLFIHRPFEIWPTLGVYRIELLYMLVVGCVWLAYPKKIWLPNPLHFAFGVFVCCVLACWLHSNWVDEGLVAVDKYLKLVVFYGMLVTTIHDEKGLKQFIDCLLLIMALYMFHSVWEFKNGRHVARMGIHRLIGIDATMNDPNALAANLLFVLALVPASWVGNRTIRWRCFLAFYVALTVGCVGLTGSRGGFVALVFATCLNVARSRHRLAFAAAVAVMTPFLWMALPPELQNRFETIIHPEVGPANAQVSAEGRLEGLRLGSELWSQYPLTGCGPGAWKVASGSKLEAHNLYGQVIGEMGTVGVFALSFVVLMFGWNYWQIRRAVRQRPVEGIDYLRHLADCLGIASLLLLLNGAFSHNLLRFTWLWYGGFYIITRHCALQRAPQVVAWPVRVLAATRAVFPRYARRPAF
jgi:O-antigen ligase